MRFPSIAGVATAVPEQRFGQAELQAWLDGPNDPKNCFFSIQSGQGGTLGDVGSHCLNLLEYVTGDPVTETSPTAHPTGGSTAINVGLDPNSVGLAE